MHAGLLADTINPDHSQQLIDLGIAPFQLLVSNLYPFEQTVASGADDGEIIEQIDIGGPAMVRAAAKNHGSVAVVTSPAQYGDVLTAPSRTAASPSSSAAASRPRPTRTPPPTTRRCLPGSPPATPPTRSRRETGWPDLIAQVWTRSDALRYGENPHQKAAMYKSKSTAGSSRTGAADSGSAT